MSSPKLYLAMHVLLGAVIAVGAPASLIVYGPPILGLDIVTAVMCAVFLVLFMMSISLAAVMIMQYAPDEMAMGPSLLAGFGMLNLGFLVSPVLFVPGLVWLWVLPFDHEGHFAPSSVLGLDFEAIEEPNHGDPA